MDCVKISFTGDIMAGAGIDRQCRQSDGGFDYSNYLNNCPALFQGSDYVVGNLETPFAGAAAEFTKATYCFNTPKEFAQEVKNIGIDLVSTANNHCMDRDYAGLLATLELLNSIKLPHVGTNRTLQERQKGFLVEINGIKVGFSAYTYGTNAFAHHLYLPEDAKFAVNLLQPEEELPGSIHLLNSNAEIGQLVAETFKADNLLYQEKIVPLQQQLLSELHNLHQQGAEVVVMLLHSGGQYNIEVDPFTEKVVDFITASGLVDLVIGNHPHVPQVGRYVNKVPVAFSLGNFAYQPRLEPDNRRNLAEYSLFPTAEFKRKADGRVEFDKMSFRICKSVNCADDLTRVFDCARLLEMAEGEDLLQLQKDLRMVAARAKGVTEEEIELSEFYKWF